MNSDPSYKNKNIHNSPHETCIATVINEAQASFIGFIVRNYLKQEIKK